MHTEEERRQRHIYGIKHSLKYKIQMNDEILDPVQRSEKHSPKGKLISGITVPDTDAIRAKKQLFAELEPRDDIFGTNQML